MTLTKRRFVLVLKLFFIFEKTCHALFTLSGVPGRVPGSGNTKWHHTWSLLWGDKQIGKQIIVIHGKHPGWGSIRVVGAERKGYRRLPGEGDTSLSLDERAGGSQRKKAVQTVRLPFSHFHIHWEQNIDEDRR